MLVWCSGGSGGLVLAGFTGALRVASLSLAIVAQSLRALFPLGGGRRMRGEFVRRGCEVDRLRDTLRRLGQRRVRELKRV